MSNTFHRKPYNNSFVLRVCPLAGIKIMGILGLSKLLADFAPSAIKDNSIKSYFGEYVTISFMGNVKYLHFL